MKIWPHEQTLIQKQSQSQPWAEQDHAVEFGDWQVFKETVPNLEVCIGSIYALERIAKENEAYHVQVMEILCAYVRQNAPTENTQPTAILEKRPKPRDDIQAVISVIGRRRDEQIQVEFVQKHRLDFSSSDFSGVNFSNLNFSAANFAHCRLEAARFAETKLQGLNFSGRF
ncbi:pentapeptide repeat-containing protein [Planktotalea sp.]|uniref:pentapeptide repeat-containing protein n=1 Tax=Planktotalea sp. TaxID=2029877 RepID=UPI0025E9177F|nr:pentapeptide repeat-containing protein [Planktotalea sp.]